LFAIDFRWESSRILLDILSNRIKFLLKALVFIVNLCLAFAVFKVIYRGKPDKGLITLGSSSGKFCEENVFELLRFLLEREEKVFYIINKNSPDISKVKSIISPLFRFSFRANLKVLRSEVIIYDTSYMDLIRCKRKNINHIKTINIFHGIHGLKKISIENADNRAASDDYIIATSEHEAKIKKSWGFSEERILLTGLPRYDALLRKNQEVKKENIIFYMPTWRPWFINSMLDPTSKEIRNFETSTYFKSIIQLATSKELNSILKENNYTLEIYIHKLMYKFIRKLNIEEKMSNIRFLDEKTNIQNQLVKSKILVTDYSSVFFDFMYLGKPVIFYQFDKTEYYDRTPGSYIKDIEIESLVVMNYEEIVTSIKDKIKDNLQIDSQAESLVKKYIKYNDMNNCNRVFGEIQRLIFK
jgi:CDP-glycerol glycerophosphotransferase